MSSSTLKKVAENSKSSLSGKTVMFGSIVDILLFEMDFDSEYVVREPLKILDKYEEAFDKCKIEITDNDWVINPLKVLEYFREIKYQPKWKDDTHLKDIEPLIKPYLNYIKETRITVPPELYQEALEAVYLIKQSNHWELIKTPYNLIQHIKTGLFEGIEFKSMLDIWNPIDNTITDLKCTDLPLYQWENTVAKKLMYPFQLAIYKDFVGNENTKLQWLVYSRPEKRTMIVECSHKDYEIGKYGNKWAMGYVDAIKLYKKCNAEYDYFEKYYTNKGIVTSEIYK
jgi:hypothetical protein